MPHTCDEILLCSPGHYIHSYMIALDRGRMYLCSDEINDETSILNQEMLLYLIQPSFVVPQHVHWSATRKVAYV